MKQTLRLSVVLIMAGLLIAACSGGATPTPDTNSVPVVTDDFSVVAEGRLLPVEFTNLSFETGGKIAEVLVKEGDTVAKDDVLARLENSDALQAQVAQAEADVLAAEQALDDLNENHDVALAQAQSAVATARKELDDADRKLKNLNFPDIEYYEDQIADAQESLQTAQENIEVTDIGGLTAALQSARDFLKIAEERLGKIQAAINGCPDCDPERSVTVDGFPQTLDDAQDSYTDAANSVRELEIQLTQAERGNTNAIDDAQERLEDAQEDLAFALNGPETLDLEIAQANAAVAQATLADAESTYTKLQNGSDPDQVAILTAQLSAAQAGLVSAQDALKNSELHAPFGGVVADLKIKVGEQAAPGAPAAVLADFSQWIVETDNLTEIEVVKVAEGQNAEIVLDALPDVTLQGTVTAISPVFEEKRGDITYTVTVTLTNGDPAMRWGMTAVTTFAK